jgi:hypothetical protein
MRHFLRLLGDGYSSFYFSPPTDDEGGGDQPSLLSQLSDAAANVPEGAAAETPAEPAPTPQPTQTTQQAPTSQPSAAPTPSPAWREVAQELGFNIPENAEEKTVFRQLMQGYAQGRQAQASLQSVMPHWDEFTEWQKSRQQQPAAAPEAKKPSWKDKPVDYDPNWRNMLQEDPLTGQLVPKPGAPMDVISRLEAAENARRNLAAQITDPTQPFAWLEDPVKELASQMAEETYKRLRAQEREEEFARNTIAAPEMAWLYQRDQTGNIQADMQGSPLLSDLGRVYRDAAAELHQMGVSNEVQHKFALAKAREAWAMQNMQNPQQPQAAPQGKQPTRREQKNEAMHAKHERIPNMAAALPGPAESFSPPPTNKENLTLRDMLATTLKDATDQDILEFAQGKVAS